MIKAMQRRHVAAALLPVPVRAGEALRYLDMAPHDRFGQYARDLLAQALRRAGLDTTLQALPLQQLSQGRLLRELQAGGLDVIWSMTDADREQRLLPVRVPIDRGLLGWRVLLVRASERAQWARPLSLAQLAAHRAGQGLHWPDVDVLRANGLAVETVVRADQLLPMLRAGRIDYYPRSVLEVQDELALPAAAGLRIAEGSWLHYPAASYFFLRPGLEALAAALQDSLDEMVDDGSLAAFFEQRLGPLLARLPLRADTALALRNPLLPAATPLRRAAYWLQPQRSAS